MRPAGALSTWANCTLTTVCTFPMFRSLSLSFYSPGVWLWWISTRKKHDIAMYHQPERYWVYEKHGRIQRNKTCNNNNIPALRYLHSWPSDIGIPETFGDTKMAPADWTAVRFVAEKEKKLPSLLASGFSRALMMGGMWCITVRK